MKAYFVDLNNIGCSGIKMLVKIDLHLLEELGISYFSVSF